MCLRARARVCASVHAFVYMCVSYSTYRIYFGEDRVQLHGQVCSDSLGKDGPTRLFKLTGE